MTERPKRWMAMSIQDAARWLRDEGATHIIERRFHEAYAVRPPQGPRSKSWQYCNIKPWVLDEDMYHLGAWYRGGMKQGTPIADFIAEFDVCEGMR